MAEAEGPKPNVLTVRMDVHDRSKLDWVWDGMKCMMGTPGGDKFIAEHGFDVGLVSWGDAYGEKEYVLERIGQYLSRWDRDDLLEGMGLEYDSMDPLEQLDELIGIWEKEAMARHGMDVTHEQRKARIKAEREAKQLKLKEQEATDGAQNT